jgi:hypothetical protein
MAKSKRRAVSRKLSAKPIDMDILDDNEPEPEGPQPLPRIDRRHVPRTMYEITAWLAPADDTGAIRRPLIHTRDVSLKGLGFRARQDVSALGEAILRLPATTGRCIAVACRVRRSLELGNGWFDGLVEFLQPQPDLAVRHMQLCMKSAAKPASKSTPKRSDNSRRRK